MTTSPTPRELDGTRLYSDLILLALKDAAQSEQPDRCQEAQSWLESNDDGFAALNTACEHLARSTQLAPSDLGKVPQQPEGWKAAIQAAYEDGRESAIEVVERDMDSLVASYAPTPEGAPSRDVSQEAALDSAHTQPGPDAPGF